VTETICALGCGRPVDPDARSTYRSISGWEGKRLKGGANAIALREETGRFAHLHCVQRETSNRKRNIPPGQLGFPE
jgi:hypothetical protein